MAWVSLFEVTKWNIPSSHLRPLKMETIERLMNSSFSRSMWKVKEDMAAAPSDPAAVEARESHPAAARRRGNWGLRRFVPVKPRTMMPR
ncbi:hypothetical protein F8388_017388 [Cannabis sativa]|uniref:Uncharacterized protein n=1 Tax=Cannabis sativa TaxID=3483 RepID=A0A7J6H923_CANSA|nr:hypothetical protein F8388_017388 [Cannabis sativa]